MHGMVGSTIGGVLSSGWNRPGEQQGPREGVSHQYAYHDAVPLLATLITAVHSVAAQGTRSSRRWKQHVGRDSLGRQLAYGRVFVPCSKYRWAKEASFASTSRCLVHSATL